MPSDDRHIGIQTAIRYSALSKKTESEVRRPCRRFSSFCGAFPGVLLRFRRLVGWGRLLGPPSPETTSVAKTVKELVPHAQKRP